MSRRTGNRWVFCEANLVIKKIADYLSGVRTEMGKVSWPTRAELAESTRLVLVLSLILAILIFFADSILSRLIDLLI